MDYYDLFQARFGPLFAAAGPRALQNFLDAFACFIQRECDASVGVAPAIAASGSDVPSIWISSLSDSQLVEIFASDDRQSTGRATIDQFLPSSPQVNMALVKAGEADYSIKPENITPTIDTSAWPLLLKNWDQRTLIADSSSLLARN